MLLLAARLKTEPAEAQAYQADWSLTSAAMENRGRAVAIIDRANRMVCANSTYERWFEGDAAPYELPFEPASLEAVNAAARSAGEMGLPGSTIYA